MSVLVVGGGPAGLMAAETLAAAGVAVRVVDHMPSVGRKLLMAGRGGLNLTHSEPLPRLLDRYGTAGPVRDAVAGFPPDAVRAWCHGLGQETFVGSSLRVFPRVMKASPLLRAWLRRLAGLGVQIEVRRRWRGLADCGTADAVVLACGGASWPRLGSDGLWTDALADCRVWQLRPANMGIDVAWSDTFRIRYAGQPLKRVSLRFGEHCVRGEAMVTAHGLEGGAVYALSAPLRDAVAYGPATLHIDLRPDGDVANGDVAGLLRDKGGLSTSNVLRRAGISGAAAGLVQEALHRGATRTLAELVRAVPVSVTGVQGLARAISTAGGLALDELDDRFMLRRHPGVFAAGEMLDWEAPTGGYLLQACLSTGVAAARGALAWLGRR